MEERLPGADGRDQDEADREEEERAPMPEEPPGEVHDLRGRERGEARQSDDVEEPLPRSAFGGVGTLLRCFLLPHVSPFFLTFAR